MNEEISQLENKVAELTAWKEARESERLIYPLDLASRKALNYWTTPNFDGIPVFTGRVLPSYIDYISDFLAVGMEITVNKQKRAILFTFVMQPFTADPATDILTNVNGSHNLNNGDLIAVNSNTALPSPLDTITAYYVVNRTGTTFQVSLTKGGSPINITDAGTGTHQYALL